MTVHARHSEVPSVPYHSDLAFNCNFFFKKNNCRNSHQTLFPRPPPPKKKSQLVAEIHSNILPDGPCSQLLLVLSLVIIPREFYHRKETKGRNSGSVPVRKKTIKKEGLSAFLSSEMPFNTEKISLGIFLNSSTIFSQQQREK